MPHCHSSNIAATVPFELNNRLTNMNKNQSEHSILYKYLDIKGANKMLSHSNLQFTNATQFNDPFDCHPSLIDFSRVPREKCKGWTPGIIELVESDRYRRYRENAWICCLSKVFDSILMWSYYNSHKGVCIGLNREIVANYLNISQGMVVANFGYDVLYRDIIEKPDYFHDEIDFFHYQICTKAKDWEHEQEVRMFILNPSLSCMLHYEDDNHNDGKDEPIILKEAKAYIEIGGECFESIHLGVNINKKEKEEIIKAARNLNPDIKIYQMELDANAFRLRYKPIMSELV